MNDSLSRLFALGQFGIKFGLGNMQAIVDRLGHPECAFRSLHIAGTNGKGSVTAMVETALRSAGYLSARYTSPHLVRLEERFVIAGQPIERASMIDALEHVFTVVDALQRERVLECSPTFFEVTTALAFELFRRAGVDVAVVEVGLGGRLDATNVLVPLVTAITSIAKDHEQYLGTSLGEIAGEKAGIVKPGVPLVVGELEPDAFTVIADIARSRGAALIEARAADVAGLSIGLRGAHQVMNAAVAARVLQVASAYGLPIDEHAIAAGLADARWPGRLDLRRLADGHEVLLDAAHNPAGAAALASYLHDQMSGPLPFVFAAMRDKDAAAMLHALSGVASGFVLTRASNKRSADPEQLAAAARRVAGNLPVSVVADPLEALAAAWQSSSRVVVAGSIFLLGDVMEAFGWS